jgi:tetratricopeptide (TPR) repeat protein
MMHSFGESKPTPEVVEQHLGIKPEEFDRRFLVWLDGQTKKTVSSFEVWKKQMAVVRAAAKAQKYDEVISEGTAIRDLYPDFVEPGSDYELLADAYLAKGDKAAAINQLQRYSSIGGRNSASIEKLATLLEEAGNKKDAAAVLARLNYIYPEDEQLHRRLGGLLLDLGNVNGAITEYQAVLASKPLDQASSHFNLARAMRQANRLDDARDQLLMSLEAAPGFKPAQRMLLELQGTEIINK